LQNGRMTGPEAASALMALGMPRQVSNLLVRGVALEREAIRVVVHSAHRSVSETATETALGRYL
jgi:hypothetical protein